MTTPKENIPPSHTIKVIINGKILETEWGENLMSLLVRNSLLLRSDCGGKGTCGKCVVKIIANDGKIFPANACKTEIDKDVEIEIPASSLFSAEVISKASISFPPAFLATLADAQQQHDPMPGIAIDLGTTSIAIYLIDITRRQTLCSLIIRNPQAQYGDDVVSRISYIGGDAKKLTQLQNLVTGAISWGIKKLLKNVKLSLPDSSRTIVVGNPTMIHILLGVSPSSIGISPYSPTFYKSKTKNGAEVGKSLRRLRLHTLPQVSGFIGGDILAAALACDLLNQPDGTLLIDLGTNGELMLKCQGGFIATSCATGPAFEGAALSCGIQAIPGAIDNIQIAEDRTPIFSVVSGNGTTLQPKGICGSGIISGVASFIRSGIIENNGAYSTALSLPHLKEDVSGRRFVIYQGQDQEISISQKDIRHVQLGKAALITGIDFLLKAAKISKTNKIFVAGAFGSHLKTQDLLTLGMVPAIDPEGITVIGNGAGGGAIMALCDDHFIDKAEMIATKTTVINLAEDVSFQKAFVARLSLQNSAENQFK